VGSPTPELTKESGAQVQCDLRMPVPWAIPSRHAVHIGTRRARCMQARACPKRPLLCEVVNGAHQAVCAV